MTRIPDTITGGFNGAALVLARKCLGSQVGTKANLVLQWGRAGFSAEVNKMPSAGSKERSCFNGAALVLARKCQHRRAGGSNRAGLQWGRAGFSAEVLALRIRSLIADKASMGPRWF